MKNVWVIVSKVPKAGFSKTRLAKDLGDQELAEKLSKAFINDFFSRIASISNYIQIYLFVTPSEESTRSYFRDLCLQHNVRVESIYFQSDTLFFQRLSDIFQHVNSMLGECFIHMTGSDIPDFPLELFKNEGEPGSVLLGPDFDGGFYYIGAEAKQSSIFKIDDMVRGNPENVFEIIKKRILSLGLNIKTMPTWSDIDVVDDLIETVNRDRENQLTYTRAVLGQERIEKYKCY